MSEEKAARQHPAAKNLQIGIDESEAQGIYANLALISHSSSEVILDFARAMPGLAKAKIHARVIMTAANAKSLHRALGENLAKYEQAHGPIKTGPQAEPGKSIGFKT
jgi:hypothetical protein